MRWNIRNELDIYIYIYIPCWVIICTEILHSAHWSHLVQLILFNISQFSIWPTMHPRTWRPWTPLCSSGFSTYWWMMLSSYWMRPFRWVHNVWPKQNMFTNSGQIRFSIRLTHLVFTKFVVMLLIIELMLNVSFAEAEISGYCKYKKTAWI